jgi:hypothetical protein
MNSASGVRQAATQGWLGSLCIWSETVIIKTGIVPAYSRKALYRASWEMTSRSTDDSIEEGSAASKSPL